MNIAITGGAGRQCLATIHDLVETSDVKRILLIDLDEKSLNKRKKMLNSPKISIASANITDLNRLSKLLEEFDVCINASSHLFNLPVMEACIASKTNYTDLGGLFHWARRQLERHEDFKEAGITGIVGSGSAPGIVNVMAKYGADRLDKIDTILILDGIINLSQQGYKFIPPYALNTIIDEFTENNYEFINGEWVELPPFSGKATVDFPEPFGRLNLYNMLHSEVATMPISFKNKDIKNVSFKLALPEKFKERLMFLIENGMASKDPLEINDQIISPRDVLLKMFENKQEEDNNKKDYNDHKILRVIVKGEKDGEKIVYELESILNPYPKWNMAGGPFTVGFPAAITARMLGNGDIQEKGFFSGESVIDPDIYFSELKKRDIIVTAKMTKEL